MTEDLLEQIQRKDAAAFTHGGKFHADDVFSAALLLYLNPEIVITRGNRVPEDFDGIVFDIGRGRYDHHQKDSRVRENGVPYAGEQSSGKSWRRNLTRRLYSRWTTTTTPERKTNWRRSSAILTRHGMHRAEATPPFFRRPAWRA